MKKLVLGLSALSLVVILTFLFQGINSELENNYVPRGTVDNVHEHSVAGAAQWQSDRRVNLETGKIDMEDVTRAKMQIGELKKQKGGLGINWKYLGPDNIGGRCRAIAIDPENPNIMYAGGVSGGLWKSTTAGGSWRQIIYHGDDHTNMIPNLNISSLCIAANGDIYFGTGEGWYKGAGTGSRGFEGAGIWKSTDGELFERLESTYQEGNTTLINTFNFVQKLAAHPTDENKIFAASNRGVRLTEDGGETWVNPVISSITTMPVNEFCGDLKMSADGTILIAKLSSGVYVSHDGGALDTWEFVSGNNPGQIPNAARIEFAIAPTDKNYIYAQSSKGDGSLQNVYKSTDGGINWDIIGPGGSADFNPLGNQGTFNNTIKVYPNNKDKIILGGQYSLWTWEKTGGDEAGWRVRTFWNIPITNLLYVHADQHELRFHPDNNDIIFVGSDGGVSRSVDGGDTWQTRNKFLGITQFYAIGYGPDGSIIGGTQDNGTLYYNPAIPSTQGTNYEYYSAGGGDGGYSEISQINPDFIFSTVYYGSLYRSSERGLNETTTPIYNSRLYNAVDPGNQELGHAFITPIALWESFYDDNSIDYAHFASMFDIAAGQTIQIEGKVSGAYYDYYLEDTLFAGDTITVRDTYQAMLAVGFRGSVWVTSEPMYMRSTPVWDPVIMFNDSESSYETTQHIHWSSCGDILYIATNTVGGEMLNGSSLYRVSGFSENRLRSQRDFENENYSLEYARIARFNNRIITGIAVDPEFYGHVILTLGNYGSNDFVYQSKTANIDPHITNGPGNFISKQGNLPQMPAYDALILWNDSRKVLVGTEFGVYSTLDINADNPTWFDENESFDYVATYSLRQQFHRNGWINEINKSKGIKNHGHIWAGTHGRGIFRTTDFEGPVEIEEIVSSDKPSNSLTAFPNPASDVVNIVIEIPNSADTELRIYDLNGKLVKHEKYRNLNKGKNVKQINVSDFRAGMYIVQMKSGNINNTTRIIVQ
jgi:hypothetical protein